MAEFDYKNNQVVGYVDFALGTTNAKIEVVGFTDWREGFHRLNDKDIIEMFPPKGKVFAHNFADKYMHTKGTLVCISVKENEKIGDYLDAYIWNKSGGVYEYGSKVKKLKTPFTANGQYNYNILKENNLLEVERDVYVSSGGNIYLIKAGSQERLISYWKENSIETLEIHGKTFVTNSIKSGEDGKIDITTDEQLIEWYIRNVLKKNWGDIFDQKSFRNVEPLLREAFNVSNGLDGLIIGSRIKRLVHINKTVTFSFDMLNELKTLPWIKDSIEQSISEHKAAYLEEVEKEKAKELQDIRERYEMEILVEKEHIDEEKQKLRKEIEDLSEVYKTKEQEQDRRLQDKKAEVELIEESIQAKQKEISVLEESIGRLEKRKDSIIEDFSVVRDVLGSNRNVNTNSLTTPYTLEEINLSDTPIPAYQAFIKSLENVFKANNIAYLHPSIIGKQLSTYNLLLVPDAAIAKAIIMASKKCYYQIEYVSATWRSFNDLWENGLGYIVNNCYKNENIMHFLILQNINLTYVPNYMMPLIDIQNRIISKLPGTAIAFPKNLRIICTITKDEVMPLSEEYLQCFGCIDKTIAKEHYDSITASGDTTIGYLTPQVLADSKESAKDVPNYFKHYLENE